MSLPTSDEFRSFCRGLHQDFLLYGPEPRDWIIGALGFVRRDKRLELRVFIDSLLTGEYSDKELQAVYSSTEADIAIWEDSEIRKFLSSIRDVLDEHNEA